METELLRGLNVAQKAAVTSNASVLQVLAPPGSGKTKTLTSRVGYLVAHHGYNPQNIICCTFTVKASREMRERLRGLVGPEFESKLVMGTFHSICRRMLVAYGYLIGIPKGFGIADSSDSMKIVKRIIKRLNLSLVPKDVRSKISSHKAKGSTWADLGKSHEKKAEMQDVMTVYHEYESDLAASQLLDYDDLLLRCVDLLRAHPECVSNVEALLIDEFQDTNVVQFELMKLLAAKHGRITIVGDPDQSIYGFRSAEIENLSRMKTTYPHTVVINLEENYRSASAVLRLAQTVIEQDKDRPQKRLKATHCFGTRPVLRRLPNSNEEALWIAGEIKRTRQMTGGLLKHSDFALLLRSASLSLLIEKAFANNGIPYRMVGGQRFFDRLEIRVIIDYLRTISHPDNNQSFLAIINNPPRKIGETTIANLVKLSQERKSSVWKTVQKVLVGSLSCDKEMSKPAEQELGRLVSLIKSARQKMSSTLPANVPSKMIDLVVKALDFENYLKRKYKDDHEDRLENIKELITHASEILVHGSVEDQLATIDGLEQQTSDGGEEVLAQFLANIVLSTDVEAEDKEKQTSRVTISTIHSAKGLEWPVVIIPALYEGSIPHSRAEDVNEERRLLYVAMTRAQALLTMTFPLMQSRDDKLSTLSQFLPTETHRYVAPVGPMFGDETIQDIATVLNRPMPTQEELVKGFELIGASDSQADDVWPVDGSRRPFKLQFETSQPTPDFSKPLGEALGRHSKLEISTTMSNTSAFSTSNMTVGFTTASAQMKTAAAFDQSRSCSHPLPPAKRPKLCKSTSANGSISTFFAKSGEKPMVLTKEALMPESTKGFQPVAEPSLPATKSPTSSSSSGKIPSELSAHRLNFRNNMIQHRPSRLEATTCGGTGRYVTLYSSSPPPPDIVESAGASHITKVHNSNNENMIPGTFKRDLTFDEKSDLRSGTVSFKSHGFSRPAQTMHVTSMTTVGQNIGIASGLAGARKTLGVRRTMNGWDNRKNK